MKKNVAIAPYSATFSTNRRDLVRFWGKKGEKEKTEDRVSYLFHKAIADTCWRCSSSCCWRSWRWRWAAWRRDVSACSVAFSLARASRERSAPRSTSSSAASVFERRRCVAFTFSSCWRRRKSLHQVQHFSLPLWSHRDRDIEYSHLLIPSSWVRFG